MTADGVPLWKLSISVPQSAVAAFENALEGVSTAVTSFGDDGTPWRIEGYAEQVPDEAAITDALALTADAAGVPTPTLTLEFLQPRDWLAENRDSFAPIHVGRFFVYPSHYDGPLPAHICLRIDAGTAFGSGTHPTTATCLRALLDLRRHAVVSRALDVGCGSGILAFAIARLWPAAVTTVDIDPEAVRVCGFNAADNALRHRIRPFVGSGLKHVRIRSSACFDLIAANVLARPLIGMAGDIAAALAPGGYVILSGLLARDGAWVLAHYRARGLILRRRYTENDWATLVLQKPGDS